MGIGNNFLMIIIGTYLKKYFDKKNTLNNLDFQLLNIMDYTKAFV